MVIVETIALSTMVCNDLVMPVLLRMRVDCGSPSGSDLTGLLLGIRRGAIVARGAAGLPLLPPRRRGLRAGRDRAHLVRGGRAVRAGDASAASTGRARRAPARSPGSRAGFAVWLYTLLLPSFAKSGWLPIGFLERRAVRHRAAQAATRCSASPGSNDITHAMLWSMLANIGAYVAVSRARRARASPSRRRRRASSTSSGTAATARDVHAWKGTASVPDLQRAARALPRRRSARTRRSRDYARAARLPRRRRSCRPTPALVQFAETALAGAIGGASARIMVASAVKEDALSIDEVHDDARRGLAGHRLQPRARAEVAGARWRRRPSCAPPTSGCRSSTA